MQFFQNSIDDKNNDITDELNRFSKIFVGSFYSVFNALKTNNNMPSISEKSDKNSEDEIAAYAGVAAAESVVQPQLKDIVRNLITKAGFKLEKIDFLKSFFKDELQKCGSYLISSMRNALKKLDKKVGYTIALSSIAIVCMSGLPSNANTNDIIVKDNEQSLFYTDSIDSRFRDVASNIYMNNVFGNIIDITDSIMKDIDLRKIKDFVVDTHKESLPNPNDSHMKRVFLSQEDFFEFKVMENSDSISMEIHFPDGDVWYGSIDSTDENSILQLSAVASDEVLDRYAIPCTDFIAKYFTRQIFLPAERNGDVIRVVPYEIALRAVENNVRWETSQGATDSVLQKNMRVFAIQDIFKPYMNTKKIEDIEKKSFLYAEHILEASGRTGVPWDLIAAVIVAESGCNQNAVSPTGAGIGLGQVNPNFHAKKETGWGRYFGVETSEDLFDPKINILVSSAILRQCIVDSIKNLEERRSKKNNMENNDNIDVEKYVDNPLIIIQALKRYRGSWVESKKNDPRGKAYVSKITKTRKELLKTSEKKLAVLLKEPDTGILMGVTGYGNPLLDKTLDLKTITQNADANMLI